MRQKYGILAPSKWVWRYDNTSKHRIMQIEQVPWQGCQSMGHTQFSRARWDKNKYMSNGFHYNNIVKKRAITSKHDMVNWAKMGEISSLFSSPHKSVLVTNIRPKPLSPRNSKLPPKLWPSGTQNVGKAKTKKKRRKLKWGTNRQNEETWFKRRLHMGKTFDLPQVLTTRVDRRAGQLGRLPSKTISSSSVKGLSVS